MFCGQAASGPLGHEFMNAPSFRKEHRWSFHDSSRSCRGCRASVGTQMRAATQTIEYDGAGIAQLRCARYYKQDRTRFRCLNVVGVMAL